jgi:hypothetical protein
MEVPNIDYIKKMSGDDETIKLKLISILKFELPLEIDAYYNSIQQKKMEQTAACVHKLKHKIGLLGLEEGYCLAEKYENQLAKNNTLSQIEFEYVLTSMQNFVNCL